MSSPEAGRVVERLRTFLNQTGYVIVPKDDGSHALAPMDMWQARDDLRALLAVVETAREEHELHVGGKRMMADFQLHACPVCELLDALYTPDSAEERE